MAEPFSEGNTNSIEQDTLRPCDARLAEELWNRYYQRVRGLARKQLGRPTEEPFDSQDIALSALNKLCEVVAEQPDAEKDDFWPLLAKITVRKAKDYRQKENAQKRTGTRQSIPLDQLESKTSQPVPDVIVKEQIQILLDSFVDPRVVKVAMMKIDGWDNQAISKSLDCNRRTVQRILLQIRERVEEILKNPE